MLYDDLKFKIINCHDIKKLKNLHTRIDMLPLTELEKKHLKEQIVERMQFLEEHEENSFLGALRTIYSPEYKDVIETQKKLVRRLKSNLKSDKQGKSCEMAIQAAMEVIGNACRSGKVQVHMGYPKESCRGFLLNTGHILHEGFFGELEQLRFDLTNIDTDVFEIKRIAIHDGYICEGRVRYVYLANRDTIDILKLRKKWQELKVVMGDDDKYAKAHLISQLRDRFTYFKVSNIEFKEPTISSDPKFKGKQCDVDILIRITVLGSAEHIEDDFERLENHIEVMRGRQGESIDQIIKDLHNAYEKGIDKYILIADNGQKITINVQRLMGEPREDNFENQLQGYISRLVIHPEEG